MFLDSVNKPETLKFFESLPLWNNESELHKPVHVFSHIVGREAQYHWAKTFEEAFKIINNPKYEGRFYISNAISSAEELESFRRMLSLGIVPMPDDGTSAKLTLGRRGTRWKQCTLRYTLKTLLATTPKFIVIENTSAKAVYYNTTKVFDTGSLLDDGDYVFINFLMESQLRQQINLAPDVPPLDALFETAFVSQREFHRCPYSW